MSVMFANTRAGQGSFSDNIVEFKAGITSINAGSTDNKRKCIAQPAKGLVYIKHTNDDLLHFYWKNRETGNNELDLIIFPGDTEFIRIKECTDGRVYMLKFKSTMKCYCFWMQEGKADKDDDYCKKVNDALNGVATARAPRVGADRAGNANPMSGLAALNSALGNSDDIGALGNMDQNQIMQLLSLMNSSAMAADTFMPQIGLNSSATNSTSQTPKRTLPSRKVPSKDKPPEAPTKKKQIFDEKTLSSILSTIPNIGAQTSQTLSVEFSNILSRANVQTTVMKNAQLLLPHVPDQGENLPPNKELEETVGNPHFRQAADFFGYAFQTGKLAEALSHFNIKDEAVKSAASGDLVDFAKKLTLEEQKNAEASAAYDVSGEVHETNEYAINEPKAKRGKTDDDDNMDLD